MNTTSRQRRGAAAVEFALSFPLLVMTFASVMELSFYISEARAVARAARDGARVASATLEGPSPTGDLITQNAADQALVVLAAADRPCEDGCTVLADWHRDDETGFWFITVAIDYPHQKFTSLVPTMGARIHSEFTMMTQQQPPAEGS